MALKALMSAPGETLTESSTVSDACRVMSRDRSGAVAVTSSGCLSGIFTYRDLVDRVILEGREPESTTLRDVMTCDVESAPIDASPGEALRKMVEGDYTYLPIVNEARELLGLVSLRGLLDHEIDHLASELDAVTQYLAVDGPGGD